MPAAIASTTLFAAALLAATALALTSDATAQGPTDDATEQPAQAVVTLQPGANEIGWITENTTPQTLFDSIPQLESIWTWHPLERRWHAAARAVPTTLWTLRELAPGMGLRLQIIGDSPVQWQRRLLPATGKVELQPGRNFIAWAGRDGWDVNQLAKGIGRALREIRRHDPATGELKTIWPVAEGAEPAAIARGDALWVEVPRRIIWLQPTDVLPALIFPGGAPPNVRNAVERDLRGTLDYFARQYGIQADPSGLVFSMPADLSALQRQLEASGEEVDETGLAELWNRAGGWVGTEIVIRREEGDAAKPQSEISYQRAITHEYFHILQAQLGDDRYDEPFWLAEGTANYSEWDQQAAGGERDWAEIESELQAAIPPGAPRLESAEQPNGVWHYRLGTPAVRRLVERSSPDAWLDFYRALAPTKIGPANRWDSAPPWHTAFTAAFGIPPDQFYADFDAWQAAIAARNPAPDPAGDQPPQISGKLVDSDGAPLAGRYININQVQTDADGNRINIGRQQRAETDAQGRFSARAPADGDYLLDVEPFGPGCTIYYRTRSATPQRERATALTITSREDPPDIEFNLPPNACDAITGRLLDAASTPLPGIRISAISNHDNQRIWSRTDKHGKFRLAVAPEDTYKISINLTADCELYPTSEGLTANPAKAATIRVADPARDIRIPAGPCGSR